MLDMIVKTKKGILQIVIGGIIIGGILGGLYVAVSAIGGAMREDYIFCEVVGGITGGLFGFAITLVKKLTLNKNGPFRRMSMFFTIIIGPGLFLFLIYYLVAIIFALIRENFIWK